ncbi:MAG: AbrB/MazE/SpoVT family DNA-binding domain-containing protein [Clostridium sp.]|nr:MAG: AbrB/MazE/SpoVT family DNA-binding domain-containing protein [Clostridium sp.]
MKHTGIIRRIDELGRIVIPKEIRKRLGIDNGDLVDIFAYEEQIVLTKFHPLNEVINSITLFTKSIKRFISG